MDWFVDWSWWLIGGGVFVLLLFLASIPFQKTTGTLVGVLLPFVTEREYYSDGYVRKIYTWKEGDPKESDLPLSLRWISDTPTTPSFNPEDRIRLKILITPSRVISVTLSMCTRHYAYCLNQAVRDGDRTVLLERNLFGWRIRKEDWPARPID